MIFPSEAANSSPFGTFGCSMKPKSNSTRVMFSEIGVTTTRSSSETRGVSVIVTATNNTLSCNTWLSLRLWVNASGTPLAIRPSTTAVPGIRNGGSALISSMTSLERSLTSRRAVSVISSPLRQVSIRNATASEEFCRGRREKGEIDEKQTPIYTINNDWVVLPMQCDEGRQQSRDCHEQ